MAFLKLIFVLLFLTILSGCTMSSSLKSIGNTIIGNTNDPVVDEKPKFSMSPVQINEGASVIALLVLDKPAKKEFNFNWSITGATPNNRFSVATGSGIVSVGDSSYQINFNSTENTKYDGNVQYFIEITDDVGSSLVAESGIYFELIDNETAPEITFTSSSQSVSESIGAVSAQINITPASSKDIELTVTVSGTSNSSDHNIASQTIVIPADTTSQNISFNITDDSTIESSETVIVTIDSATSDLASTVGTQNVHTLTILDNDFVIVEPVYPSFANWNDYVKVSNASLKNYKQTETACLGTEAKFQSCIHGGEFKKVSVTDKTSCTNLSISDSLNLFNWVCDATGANVVFYSTGLKKDKGLRHLINFSSAGFLNNFVTVLEGSTTIASSVPSAWWTNTVKALPANTGAGAMNLPNGSDLGNTIYVVNASTSTSGYNLNSDKLSIVSNTNAVLQYSGNATNNCNGTTGEYDGSSNYRAIFCTGAQKFLWLEANNTCAPASGSTAYYGVFAYNTQHSVFKNYYSINCYHHNVFTTSNSNLIYNLRGQVGNAFIILIQSSKNNHIEKITASNFNDFGAGIIRLEYGGIQRFNVLNDIKVSNSLHTSGGIGIKAYGDGQYLNIYSNIVSSNNYADGMSLSDSDSNIVTHSTFSNNGRHGVYLGDKNLLVNAIAANNGQMGVAVVATNVWGATVYNIASVDNGGVGVNSTDTNSGGFKGYILIGNNNSGGSQCSSTGTNPGIVNGTCTADGADGSSSYSWANSNAVLRTGKSSNSSFVGQTASDIVNSSLGASSSSLISYASVSDWFNFENTFRLFGLDGAANYPNSANRGNCTTGLNCRIWDWSLKSTDTTFLNKSGDGTTSNQSFVAGSTCPSQVNGNNYVDGYNLELFDDSIGDEDGICEAGEACDQNIFLTNATEITIDGIGDDDTLCEANESCIYSPNVGAYQGHGDYMAAGTCNFTNGSIITGVSMYAYPNNGR